MQPVLLLSELSKPNHDYPNLNEPDLLFSDNLRSDLEFANYCVPVLGISDNWIADLGFSNRAPDIVFSVVRLAFLPFPNVIKSHQCQPIVCLPKCLSDIGFSKFDANNWLSNFTCPECIAFVLRT